MSEEHARQRRIRGGHKASATRTLTRVDDALAEESRDVSKLRQLQRALEDKVTILRALDERILEKTPDDDVEDEIQQADMFAESIQLAIMRLTDALEGVEAAGISTAGAMHISTRPHISPPPTSPPPPALPETAGDRARVVTSGSGTARVKLPRLTLKKFNGDVSKWTSYWDSFKSAVHENPDLSDIDRFNYLSSTLEHSAAEAIAGLSITASNYREAVAVLTKRFGNKQLIVNKHMEVLLNLEPVTSNHNMKGLRSLYDQIESHVRALKALGVTSDAYGTLLSSVLMNKLPSEFRLVVSRHIVGDNWELDPLMELIEKEIEARERAHTGTVAPPQTHTSKRNPPSTAATLMTGSHGMNCCYCKQAHPASTCPTVIDTEARKQVLRREGRCYVCLKKNHLGRNCRSHTRCSLCNGRHHTSICQRGTDVTPSTDRRSPSGDNPPPGGQQSSTRSTQMYVNSETPVLLQTATAPVYGRLAQAQPVLTRIILDSGSQRSYITDRLKETLALETVCTETILVKTFGSSEEKRQECEVVNLKIGTKDGGYVRMTAFVVPLICEPICGQPIRYAQETFGHLVELELADLPHDGDTLEVDILIGSDYYWRFATGRVQRGRTGPIAIHTRLGWVLSGPLQGAGREESVVNLAASTHVLRVEAEVQQDHSLDTQLKKFWDLESLGITSDESSVYDKFTSKISFSGGRYEVRLPWKEVHPELPDNFKLSCKRLGNLMNRLRRSPELLSEYDLVIKDQLRQGIVEPVKEPFTEMGGRIHYLPHHAVVRRDKQTTKLRIVYDASARSGDGPSLNSCLYTGPPSGQNIFNILLRFRLHKTALAGDIEKAFLMVSVAEEDRDVLRFVWFDEPKQEEPNLIVLRFTRVVFGVSASPFLLNATIAQHMEKYREGDPEFVTKFSRAIYVDDVSFGAEDDGTAFQLYLKSKQRLAEGGFNLRKFVTNSPNLRARVQDCELQTSHNTSENDHQVAVDDQSYSKTSLGSYSSTTTEEQKILGVHWNYVRDHFEFDLSTMAQAMDIPTPTKRDVVGVTTRFFDPLGVVSPVTIQFKLLFQEMCKSNMSWDEPLTGELLSKWNILVTSLKDSVPLTIPRCYFTQTHSPEVTFRLQGYSDASMKAYAAVVYLEIGSEDTCQLRFVAAKTRVSPTTPQSIPRLELLASLLLARLVTSVQEALKFELTLKEPVCFTDSRVVLHWIKGTDREWKQFVENRVREIRRLVPMEMWRHCPGRYNPADIPSRGMNPTELAETRLWWNGPEQIEMTECNEGQMPEECLSEAKGGGSHTLLVHSNFISISHVIRCQDFSSLKKLLMVTAYVMKFVKRLKGTQTSVTTDVTPGDLAEAHRMWIQEMQTPLLTSDKFKQRTQQLDLYCDDEGVWRCGGRLSNANIPVTAQHPILLDKRHHLATLIVRECHDKVGHSGVRDTLTQLRTQYWVIGGRQFVRKVLYRCVICRRFAAKPFTPPTSPPLPPCRVREAPPFCYTGVDFAGPLYVVTGQKVWICLFTCCLVRAIHLELVPSLTTHAFIRCFKRFTARRGFPMKIISDNGRTFKSAAKTIAGVLNHPTVRQHLCQANVEWSFNLQKAPWQGGIFERMIKSTKSCLKKIIGKAKLTYEELLTSLAEVEMIINSRPLTYSSPEDLEEPLTPSHLLIGRRVLTLPDAPRMIDKDYGTPSDHSELTRRMKHFNKVIDHFWKRWRHEYLLELRISHRHQSRNKEPSISIGQVVLIHDENRPRGLWKLALVREVIKSSDGQVRGVRVRTHSEGGRIVVLNRPVQRLYPLEVHSADDHEREGDDTSSLNQATTPSEGRPSRRAAANARDRIMAYAMDSEDD